MQRVVGDGPDPSASALVRPGESARDRRWEIGSSRDAQRNVMRVVVSSKSRDEGPDLDLILDLTKDPQRVPKQCTRPTRGRP
jgi:hypothetical protein